MVRKRLYRSRTDRMLFGVAGGFADWLDVDPAVVRIVWALLVFAGGAGFFLYIVAAIVMPEEPWPGTTAAPAGPAPEAAGTAGVGSSPAPNTTNWGRPAGRPRDGNGAVVLGGLLVLVGLWFFARNLLPAFDDRFVLPAFLVVLGAILVLWSLRNRR